MQTHVYFTSIDCRYDTIRFTKVPHLKTANLNTKLRITFLICPVYNIKQVTIKPKGLNDYSRTVITLLYEKALKLI